ncbi:MAG: NAD-dependent epimerase/dehydratase family protein, partial [Selenomonadaceae bacterium]|nr:NAD-dependent epimerase/dehydratase family protein [Selenomonadaceae bacterium]
MKILMTGITGFIGHHLGERLVNDGHEVHAIVRPTSKIDELSDNLRRNVKFHVCDKDNTVLDIVTDLCADNSRPDLVYHLATNYLNAHKFEDIQGLIQSNITFGTELLEALVTNGVYNFVNVGTFAQHYEDADYSPVNLYAATKESFGG